VPSREQSVAFRRVLDYYAQSRSGAYDPLPSGEKVQVEDEIYAIERELFVSESHSRFTTLRDLVISDSASDRLAALMILYRGECTDDAILDSLVGRLSCESDPETLKHLILWFRYHRKDDRALNAICGLCDHPDYMVRTSVADTLGAYRHADKAVDVLLRLAHDPHPNVRCAATEELQGRAV
jgi:HEAT repeats